MHFLFQSFQTLLVAFFMLTTAAFSAEVTESSASVPEPSVAVLGGLCGLLILIWRKK